MEHKYLPDKRNLHVRVLSGHYYWIYDNPVLPASNSEMEYRTIDLLQAQKSQKKIQIMVFFSLNKTNID
jgi:hypothetical protein